MFHSQEELHVHWQYVSVIKSVNNKMSLCCSHMLETEILADESVLSLSLIRFSGEPASRSEATKLHPLMPDKCRRQKALYEANVFRVLLFFLK